MIQQRGTLWLAVFSTALLLPSSAAAQTPISPARPGVQYMRGAVRNAAASASSAAGAANNPLNVSYFGGLLSPNATIYAIWWGKPSDFPADPLGIDDFLETSMAQPTSRLPASTCSATKRMPISAETCSTPHPADTMCQHLSHRDCPRGLRGLDCERNESGSRCSLCDLRFELPQP